jgi:hypothetical protein
MNMLITVCILRGHRIDMLEGFSHEIAAKAPPTKIS